MKKLLSILVILFNFYFANAQDIHKEILGIPWGASKKEVKEKMLQRENVKFDKEEFDKEKYSDDWDWEGYRTYFSDGEFVGYSVEQWMFEFTNEQLTSVEIYFKSNNDNEAKEILYDLAKTIELKYGKNDLGEKIDIDFGDKRHGNGAYEWLIKNKKNKIEISTFWFTKDIGYSAPIARLSYENVTLKEFLLKRLHKIELDKKTKERIKKSKDL